MIDKLFPTKVKMTNTNSMVVEYCKRLVKTWCFDLETKEEYDYSYNEFRRFVDSDRTKTKLIDAHEKMWTHISSPRFYPRSTGWCNTGGMQLGMLILAHHAKQSMKADHSRHQVEQNHNRISSVCSGNGEQGGI
jgi:hypothetical protein